MARSSCENCGCAVYDGRCTNCHEALYILDQYDELDMELPAPDSQLMQEARKAEEEIARKKAMGPP